MSNVTLWEVCETVSGTQFHELIGTGLELSEAVDIFKRWY